MATRKLRWAAGPPDPRPNGTTVIAVDPGAVSGLAALYNGQLCYVSALHATDLLDASVMWHIPAWPEIHIVWEKPEVYANRRKSRPESLLTTAFRAGRLVAMLELSYTSVRPTIVPVLPKTWKGQVPKDIHNDRVHGALAPAEHQILNRAGFTKTELDDVLDAIGLAKWYHHRLGLKETP